MASINPSDLLFIEGRYGQQAAFPATPGFEGVGIVEAAGGVVVDQRVDLAFLAVLDAGEDQVDVPVAVVVAVVRQARKRRQPCGTERQPVSVNITRR